MINDTRLNFFEVALAVFFSNVELLARGKCRVSPLTMEYGYKTKSPADLQLTTTFLHSNLRGGEIIIA